MPLNVRDILTATVGAKALAKEQCRISRRHSRRDSDTTGRTAILLIPGVEGEVASELRLSMKGRPGPDGLHLFDRRTGLNVLLDEVEVPEAGSARAAAAGPLQPPKHRAFPIGQTLRGQPHMRCLPQ
jgi:hypothetical protein